MAIKINYLKNTNNKASTNLVLFSGEKFNVKDLKKYLSNSEFIYIEDLIKTIDIKKNIFVFEIGSKKKIILIKIKKDLRTFDFENLGAEFFGRINQGKNSEYHLISDSISGKYDNFLGHFLHGLKLKSYEFKKYKTKKENRYWEKACSDNPTKPGCKLYDS